MQDEQFMRVWNSQHARFSTHLHRALRRILRAGRQRPAVHNPIGRSYALLARYEQPKPARPRLSLAAQASLGGFAASVITVTLWSAVMMAATPELGLA